MLLCKIIVPTKLYFSSLQPNKNLVGIIGHSYNKYQTGVQRISFKYCFGSSLSHACIAMSQVYKIPAVTITTSTKLCAKLYVENENNFAHDTMEQLPTYDVIPSSRPRSIHGKESPLEVYHHLKPKNWNNELPCNICKAFESISKHASLTNVLISDKVFSEMCQSIVEKAPAFTTSELYKILSSLTMWKLTNSPFSLNFYPVWTTLDKECVSRVEQWDVATLLCFADAWYVLHLSKFCKYMTKCVKILDHQRSTLSPSQLVQSVFYVCTSQTQEHVSLLKFESHIAMCTDELSLNELAIVAMSFFKTKTGFTRYLAGIIIQRLIYDVDTVHEISLAALMKIIRYSKHVCFTDQLGMLLDKLLPKVHTLSLQACIQVVMSSSAMQIFHEELLKAMSLRFVSNVRSLRMKDLENILYVLTSLDYDPKTMPCIYEQILKELHNHERDQEIKLYPYCLVACLQNLSFRNMYSSELSNKVLDPQFIEDLDMQCYERVMQALLVLDTSITIDYPSYEGNRLSSELRYMSCYKVQNLELNHSDECIVMKFAQVLEIILGHSTYIYCGHILPIYPRRDVVYGLANGYEPVKIPDNFRTSPLGHVKHPPIVENNVQWYCLVYGSRRNYSIPKLTPMVMVSAKMRQLRILGYIPILIPFYEWPKRSQYQKKYLQKILRLKSHQ